MQIIEQPKPPIECSCVRYVESLVPGVPLLDAIDYPINTIEPKVGDIIKLQYYNASTTRFIYHVALIKEVAEETYTFQQGNKPKCATSTETISKNDERILGFFNPERQKLIDNLTPIQRETLWNESRWSHYKHNAVLRGAAGEWGVAQFLKTTWKWLAQLRRKEGLSMLDKLDFEDQITMFQYGWDKGVVWYGRPESVVSE